MKIPPHPSQATPYPFLKKTQSSKATAKDQAFQSEPSYHHHSPSQSPPHLYPICIQLKQNSHSAESNNPDRHIVSHPSMQESQEEEETSSSIPGYETPKEVIPIIRSQWSETKTTHRASPAESYMLAPTMLHSVQSSPVPSNPMPSQRTRPAKHLMRGRTFAKEQKTSQR
ncbi:hypothetical protein OCU04_012908 [Sclerotinia nivalis]|uniref:Uncharacterized protein n=1 Tax=Sclerotinia nivalis TaxID=352851 RepID=A0A9X0A8M9_9HELO|nr:hypothetical protein OCU04_012908 [Sclerotinia nivalis]